jgi:uncharacterized RDD family membrane protein YckC
MPHATSSLYAGWGRRFAAWAIDLCIVGLLAALLAATLGAAAGRLAWLVGAGYFVILHRSRSGQTLGKKLTGIAVRNADSLGRIGLGRSLLRFGATALLWVLLVLPALLDGLSPLWNPKHQSWHDRIAGTVVVRL